MTALADAATGGQASSDATPTTTSPDAASADSPNANDAAEAAVSGDSIAAATAADAGADSSAGTPAVLSPPVSVAGAALWLDGTLGLSASDPRSGIGTWADRSGLGHVFVGQTDGMTLPQASTISSVRAVQLSGEGSRLIIEESPTQAQQESLTFENDEYVLAIAFQADPTIVDPTPQASFQGDNHVLVKAQTPWLPEIPSPNVGPFDSNPFTLSVSSAGLVTFGFSYETGLGVSNLSATAQLPGAWVGVPHVLVISVLGTQVTMRADGAPLAVDLTLGACQTFSLSMTCPAPSFSYAPIYIGGWDWGFAGFPGRIGDFVVVKGDPGSDLDRLESYLLTKYRL
jgi:hypothetical protein